MNNTWLEKLPSHAPENARTPMDLARAELAQVFPENTPLLTEVPDLQDGYAWQTGPEGVTLSGGRAGLLYGAYDLIRRRLSGAEIPDSFSSSPRYALRMVNCWDNADGTVERGYSGRSLFFEGNRLDYDPDRIRQLARMLASVGLNVLCINNVNVREPAQELLETWLPDLARLADLFRPFGVRLMLSVDFSQPMRRDLPTADPLDPRVQEWWKQIADRVYAHIPDLAGFLVKADSEGRPGPFTYQRNHAEGANLLARALKPHGGVLVWRCFVYNCRQDWRDTRTDRGRAAYDHYADLDGAFDENVILQIKHGPFDFQVREPLSPLLLAMPGTNLALELQLAQEYTGHQIDLYTMMPMWRELMEDLPEDSIMSMAAVSNLGRDDNYTGHPLAAANLFGYGLFAWNPGADPAEILDQWIHLTYDFSAEDRERLISVMLSSRRTYEKYTAPLGLGWMVTPHVHYGPNPSGYEYDLWGTYHKADCHAVGVDRTEAGTGYLTQYPEALRRRYEDPETCPDLYKLFFHRLPYTFRMPDGRTMIQRIYDDHFEGYEETERMAETLDSLPFPEPDAAVVRERMDRQLANAREWRDVINTFFHRLSGIPDEQGRVIYD